MNNATELSKFLGINIYNLKNDEDFKYEYQGEEFLNYFISILHSEDNKIKKTNTIEDSFQEFINSNQNDLCDFIREKELDNQKFNRYLKFVDLFGDSCLVDEIVEKEVSTKYIITFSKFPTEYFELRVPFSSFGMDMKEIIIMQVYKKEKVITVYEY